MKNYIFILALI